VRIDLVICGGPSSEVFEQALRQIAAEGNDAVAAP